jgi:FAD:protein FMN transferase
METFTFSALGTKWTLLLDHDVFPEEHQRVIVEEVASFENRFSRFILTSEVNQFRDAVSSGTYEVSEEFAVLLTRADQLRQLTNGIYDPAIGGLLEHAGYDPTYRLESDQKVETFQLPKWSLSGRKVTLDGSVVFDLGGIGKGYCIDLVASILERLGYQYYLVEGGGDMYGTTKRDGSPYKVALEWPGKPDTAFGVVHLDHQAVAVSDSFKRRWQKWHHIIDPHAKKPIEGVLGCAALARNAFAADSMTSGLFLSSEAAYPKLAEVLGAEYVVFRSDGTAGISSKWPGELF